MTRATMMFLAAVIITATLSGCYDPEETGPRQVPTDDAGIVPTSDGGPVVTACELDPQTQDQDGHGYCPAGHDIDHDGTCCDAGEALDPNAGDCNDDPRGAGALIGPGVHEICGNGIDEDCDGLIDDGCGTDVAGVDASDAPVDVCRDPRCLRLEGRAGPLGNCACRAPGSAPLRRGTSTLAWSVAALALAATRRRGRVGSRGPR